MEIFGVGLPELMLVAVVALIVLGPERMPEAARTIGKTIADFRRAIEPARSAWRDISTEITNVANSTTSAITPSLVSLGNPYEVHPILQMMTDEERENYVAGGEMPEHVAAQMAQDVNKMAPSNGHQAYHQYSDGAEPPLLDYSMPHSQITYEPAPPFSEELNYPQPGKPADQEGEAHDVQGQ